MSMQIRGKLLAAVSNALSREGYRAMGTDAKISTLREVLLVEASKLRNELVEPIEKIVADCRTTVDRELLTRIEKELRDGSTEADKETEEPGGDEDRDAE